MADCTVWQDVIEFLEAQLDGQGRPWAREAMRQLPHEPPGFAMVTEMPELRQVLPPHVHAALSSRFASGMDGGAHQPQHKAAVAGMFVSHASWRVYSRRAIISVCCKVSVSYPPVSCRCLLLTLFLSICLAGDSICKLSRLPCSSVHLEIVA